jgi:ribonuclease R
MPVRRRSSTGPLPTREQIIDFVENAEGKVGKREIARAFKVSGADRVALKTLMRELADDGVLVRSGRRAVAVPGVLPPVVLAEVTGLDRDGEAIARPAEWHGEGEPPVITVLPQTRRGVRPPKPGDRALIKVKRLGDARYEGRVLKVLEARAGRLVGVYRRAHDGADAGRLQPSDRRNRTELAVADGDAKDAKPGDLVVAEMLTARLWGLRQARVIEVLADIESPRAIGLLVLNAHAIPHHMPEAAEALAARAKPPALGKRKDLRDLALVTIDDEDARDFDDAIWAEPDADAANEGGWHVVVAIADVAHFVRPGDAIDTQARKRGNSVYLPDMVVPMLPEALSNGLCSLKPGAERACLAVHLWINRDGAILRHRFERGLMRSAARLTYSAVQAAIDKTADREADPIADDVLMPLVSAWQSLRRGRAARGTLDFDLPDRRVLFDDSGEMRAITARARHDSHRIVEEFMIAANVAAAETLIAKRAPCLFRIHDQPPLDKLEGLRDYLASLGYKLTRSRHLTTGHFNTILKKAADTPEALTVAMMVLRAQSQAEYNPDNIGHFGLNLTRYAHFTSPIRRYADLLVHRSLIRALKLGPGGLPTDAGQDFAEIGAEISATERRATIAERDAMDRFSTRYLAARVGAKFEAAITGVTRFGLFVRLQETGAEGLIPIRDFGEYMRHDAAAQRLVGEDSGREHRLGETLSVTLAEADPVTGSLRFELANDEKTIRKDATGKPKRAVLRRKPRGRRR